MATRPLDLRTPARRPRRDHLRSLPPAPGPATVERTAADLTSLDGTSLDLTALDDRFAEEREERRERVATTGRGPRRLAANLLVAADAWLSPRPRDEDPPADGAVIGLAEAVHPPDAAPAADRPRPERPLRARPERPGPARPERPLRTRSDRPLRAVPAAGRAGALPVGPASVVSMEHMPQPPVSDRTPHVTSATVDEDAWQAWLSSSEPAEDRLEQLDADLAKGPRRLSRWVDAAATGRRTGQTD